MYNPAKPYKYKILRLITSTWQTPTVSSFIKSPIKNQYQTNVSKIKNSAVIGAVTAGQGLVKIQSAFDGKLVIL